MDQQKIFLDADSPLWNLFGMKDHDLQQLEERAREVVALADLGQDALADLRQEGSDPHRPAGWRGGRGGLPGADEGDRDRRPSHPPGLEDRVRPAAGDNDPGPLRSGRQRSGPTAILATGKSGRRRATCRRSGAVPVRQVAGREIITATPRRAHWDRENIGVNDRIHQRNE